MRFSIAIPQLAINGFDAAGTRSFLERAEELGFEGGWTLEQTIGEAPLIAPMELLAYAAACSSKRNWLAQKRWSLKRSPASAFLKSLM